MLMLEVLLEWSSTLKIFDPLPWRRDPGNHQNKTKSIRNRFKVNIEELIEPIRDLKNVYRNGNGPVRPLSFPYSS